MKINVIWILVRIISYIGDKIFILGKCYFRYGNYVLEFYVIEIDLVFILGFRLCRDLGLVKLIFAI